MVRSVLLFASAIGALSTVPAFAQTSINFNDVASGTAVSNQFSGVKFSLTGGEGPDGSPLVTNVFGDSTKALTNSSTGGYPTSAYLNVVFDTAVSGVSFSFNNYGTSVEGRGASGFSAYGSEGNLISSGFLGFTNDYSLINPVTGSGIKSLVFSNGTNGEDSWQFGIGQLNFTPAAATAAVPEPATWALMILGFGVVGFAMRRRNAVRTTVRYV